MSNLSNLWTVGIPAAILGMTVTFLGLLLLWAAIALIGKFTPRGRE